ncbi:MAG: right-handed parallel beta-helix repeat-containing protein, partial [Actinobacteria bacterium]|nr:right-handed parallel beta-helix repeat-containing protein [Actinomycetota bacterium]
MTADVGPCQGDGIIIGADHVTLRLNGHQIVGDSSLQDGPGNRAGIRLPNRTDVRIVGDRQRQSTVREFDGGIAIIRGLGNSVTNLTVADNIGPRQIFEPDFGDGIFVDSSKFNLIKHNIVRHNGTFDGIGLNGVTRGNVIEDNDVVDNNVLKPEFFDKGIVLGPGATHNVVNNNLVRGSGPFALQVGQQIVPSPPPDFEPDPRLATPSVGNVITNNRVIHNDFLPPDEFNPEERPGPGVGLAIAFGAERSLVSGNVVRNNANIGIGTVADYGRFIGNTALNNGVDGAGGDIADNVADNLAQVGVIIPPCGHNIYRANVFDRADACVYIQEGRPVPPLGGPAAAAPSVLASKP